MSVTVYATRVSAKQQTVKHRTIDTSGTHLLNSVEVDIKNSAASSTITFAQQHKTNYIGTANQTGHFGACLDYVTMSATGRTATLAIPHEAKLDVNAGTVTTAVLSEAQIGANAGTITTLIGFRPYINANTGTIGTFYGIYGPDHSGISGVTTKYFAWNADTGAPLVNLAATYMSQPIYFADYTFATLPAASAWNTYCAMCNDNGASNYPAIVRSNGTNWIIADNTGTQAS